MLPDLDLTSADGGRATLVAVRAQPGARRATGSRRAPAAGVWNRMLKLAVAAPPQDGRANEELLRLLARLLGLRASSVSLVRGARSREKVFRVESRLEIVRARLAEVVS